MATMKDITIDVTYAELTALIAVSGLFQGVNYLITDRGDRGLLFKAASTSQLEIQGTRYMLCPATYASGVDTHGNNWIGVWNGIKTAALNDLTIWNGQVWKCILAVTEPLTAPDVNAVNWVLIPKATFVNYEYIEKLFIVFYDIVNDWIYKQIDTKNNEFGCDFANAGNLEIFPLNCCDIADWNRNGEFYGNKCLYVVNNSDDVSIINNTILGAIFNNFCISITLNKNMGNIDNNNVDEFITKNRNSGHITNNTGIGVIENNSNSGNIYSNNSTESASISSNNNIGYITGTWGAGGQNGVLDNKIGV